MMQMTKSQVLPGTGRLKPSFMMVSGTSYNEADLLPDSQLSVIAQKQVYNYLHMYQILINKLQHMRTQQQIVHS
jgi:hypothetical protein